MIKKELENLGMGAALCVFVGKTFATSVDSDIRLPGKNQASEVSLGSPNRQRLPNTLPECFIYVRVDITLLIVENLKCCQIILNDKRFWILVDVLIVFKPQRAKLWVFMQMSKMSR